VPGCAASVYLQGHMDLARTNSRKQVRPSGLAGDLPPKVLTDSLVSCANTVLNGSEGCDLFTNSHGLEGKNVQEFAYWQAGMSRASSR